MAPKAGQDERLEHADAALRRCNELIAEEAKAEWKKESTLFRTRKILTNIDQVAMVLEGIAELHPIAKGAVKQFRTLICLELERQNNNEQIVAICHAMANMLYTIHLITDDFGSDESSGLRSQLEDEMERATAAMCDFGAFADMYYIKMSARVVRYLRTSQFKRALLNYSERFNQHRRNIRDILTARIHSQASRSTEDLSIMLNNTEQILEKMTACHTDAELVAAKIVEEYGGEEQTMRKPDAVRRVADVLESEPGAHKEPVTLATFHLLNGDLATLLEENRGRFELKLDSAKMEIKESVDRTAELIMGKLDQGPYSMIEDPEVRELWKISNWRMSAKARSFFHELFMHYSDIFHRARLNGEPVPDHWTLKVLDVTYHPAITEAVDEDATGYLSVHELNHFTQRKPPHFPIPVWFAFWAVGCRYLNATLTSSIENNLADIERKCEQLKNDISNKDFVVGIEEYQNTCALLRCVLSYCELVDTDEHRILADLDDDTSGHIQEWAHSYREYLAKGFDKRLQPLNYYIDDGTLLPVVIDTADDRIEQAFFPLVDVIVKNQQSTIKEFYNSSDRRPKRVDQFTQRLAEMDGTIYTLLSEYHKRMKGLMRSWRAQKLDVELELECYVGGIMYGWYTAYQQPDNSIKEKFDRSTPGTHMSKRAARTISALSGRVEALSKQVDSLDGRIAQMNSMLEKRATPEPSKFTPDKRDLILVILAGLLVFKFRR